MLSRVICLVLGCLVLSGCQNLNQFVTPKPSMPADTSAPADQAEAAPQLETLTITEDRRLILSNLKTGDLCAEPPAEAAETLANAIATALQAEQSAAKAPPLQGDLAERVQRFYQRAHTVQLFRDAAFYLCINAINQSDNRRSADSDYRQALKDLLKGLNEPLREEIRYYYQAEIARARSGVSAGELIVCTPGSGKKAAGIQCQRMGTLPESNPSVIEPPLTPEQAPSNPVM